MSSLLLPLRKLLVGLSSVGVGASPAAPPASNETQGEEGRGRVSLFLTNKAAAAAWSATCERSCLISATC